MRKNTLGVFALSLWIIVGQVLRLASWYLPYPLDIKILLFLMDPAGLTFLNVSSILAIVLAVKLIYDSMTNLDEETIR